MKNLKFTFFIPIMIALFPSSAISQAEVATICNETGVCTAIDPAIGLAILALSTFEKNINANIDAAGNENGELAKALRVVSGISVSDIDKYGLCGGKNSEVRKIFADLCPKNVD